MTKPSQDESTKKFRAIMDGDKDEDDAPKPRTTRHPEPSRNLLDLLPRAAQDASPAPEPKPAPSRDLLNLLPRSTPEEPPEPRAAPPPARKKRLGGGIRIKVRREALRSAFWDVTSWVSLAVDAVLIAVVIILLFYVRRLNVQYNELLGMKDMPVEAVSGLYENFEKMNGAHIRTTIPLNTEIPIQFDLQIDQQTEVVLSQAITINGAHVTLATGGLEINSVASIILPAGTRLPIMLSLNVPVSRMVPVSLQVPVDIDLATTDLGAAFTGLMDVLEPLYCLLDPNAVDSNQVSICEKSKTP